LEPRHKKISVRRQCELIGLNRSTAYYRFRKKGETNLRIEEAIDKQYVQTPFYGVPRMTAHLRREGFNVNPKRVRRAMRGMGLMAIYPRRRSLSRPEQSHPKSPYLLKGVAIRRPDDVWASDITYLCLRGGFVYLTAIMDWHSRFVLSWELSNTLDAGFCVSALDKALTISRPKIFNSDRGSQYTSRTFVERLERVGVRISTNGRGRVFDNIFVERLWRSVKYEAVYLKDYASVSGARENLAEYFRFYNERRPHQALDWRTPAEVYFDNREVIGGSDANSAVTTVGLRPPSVTADQSESFHLNLTDLWS